MDIEPSTLTRDRMCFNMAFMSLQYGVHDSQPQPHAFLDAAFLAAEIWVEDARKQIRWDTLAVVSYGNAWFGSTQLSIREDASCVVPGKALWKKRQTRYALSAPFNCSSSVARPARSAEIAQQLHPSCLDTPPTFHYKSLCITMLQADVACWSNEETRAG